MRVNEIFYSIQGESSYAGMPCVFVRLAGCNLRCSYCDTQYAYEEGQELNIDDIIERVMSYRSRLVEITGGEPLLQKDTPELVYRLLEQSKDVLLETNGTLDIGIIDRRCVKIVDIKCPSSGAVSDLDNLYRLSEKDEIKYVIGNRNDYEYAKTILVSLAENGIKIKPPLFSPIHGKIDPKLLAEWIIDDHLDVRMQIQLHKIIWGSEARGV